MSMGFIEIPDSFTYPTAARFPESGTADTEHFLNKSLYRLGFCFLYGLY